MSESQRDTGGEHSAGSPTKSRIVTVIFVIWGLLMTIFGLLFVAYADAASDVPVADAAGVTEIALAAALIMFLIAAIDFATGYGIWKLTEWGWYAGIVVSGLSTLLWISGVLQNVDLLGLVFLLAAAFCVWGLWDERDHFPVDI